MYLNMKEGLAICDRIDGFVSRVGKILAWLNVLLIADIMIQVVLRYGFGHGSVVLEETQWHLYAVCIMFGIPYTLVHDSHIRLDVASRKFSDPNKALIEFLGTLFLLLPFAIVLFIHSLDFVHESWRVGEASESPMGLPWRWAIKSVIPLSMGFLCSVSVTRLIRAAAFLLHRRSFRGSHGTE